MRRGKSLSLLTSLLVVSLLITNLFVMPVQAATPRAISVISDIRALLVQVDQKVVQPIKDIDIERIKDTYDQGQYLYGLHKQYVENSKEVVHLNKEIANTTKQLRAEVGAFRASDDRLTDEQLLQMVSLKRDLQVHIKQTAKVTKKVGTMQGKYLKNMKNKEFVQALGTVKITVALQDEQLDALQNVLVDLQGLVQVFQQ